MRRFRLNGWQRNGTALSVLWALSVSMWFFQQVHQANDPGIASVYLQCISQPNPNRGVCKARAEWFSEEARAELRADWSWVALAPIVVAWLLVYVVMWAARWIRRGFQPST
jgi:hypothetical protein